MKINPSRSSTVKLGSPKSETTYSINNIVIPEVQSIRDLGLVYDTRLKFDDYISKITSRAYQRIGLILRGFTSRNTELLRKAFIV